VRRRVGPTLLATLLLLSSCSLFEDEPPRRVLLVGDSIMNQVAEPLRRRLGPEVDVRNEAVGGSGLLTPEVVDWPARLRQVVENWDPDAVVLLFVGNYIGDRWETPDGHVIQDKSDPAFFEAWAARSDESMSVLADEVDEVVWVLPPPMRSAEDQRVVERLREIYLGLEDRWPGIEYVDGAEVLGGPDGEFVPRGRDPDGVHLRREGAQRLAEAIHESLTGG
jgi:hypothetical protein